MPDHLRLDACIDIWRIGAYSSTTTTTTTFQKDDRPTTTCAMLASAKFLCMAAVQLAVVLGVVVIAMNRLILSSRPGPMSTELMIIVGSFLELLAGLHSFFALRLRASLTLT